MIDGPQRPRIKTGTRITVDAATGAVMDVKTNAATLLPPPPGVCQECAVDHAWNQPHNKQSLYYQMAFHATHGRYPTWSDAMSHCPPEVQTEWRPRLVEQMRRHGLPVPPDLQESS